MGRIRGNKVSRHIHDWCSEGEASQGSKLEVQCAVAASCPSVGIMVLSTHFVFAALPKTACAQVVQWLPLLAFTELQDPGAAELRTALATPDVPMGSSDIRPPPASEASQEDQEWSAAHGYQLPYPARQLVTSRTRQRT